MGQPAPEERGLSIDIFNLHKTYGARGVLRNFNLSIAPGEFVAVIGRSGCGKTTLLRLIAGLDEVTSGEIWAGDKLVQGLNPDVRLMFQEARLLPWQSVVENVGVARGPSWRDKACEVLQRVGLEGRENDWPAKLSGGQKQRAALARALISKPKVLLLDEPFGALDALTRLEMHSLLKTTREQYGFTTVLITHDVTEAVALADRVIVLQEGEITLDLPINLTRSNTRRDDAAAAGLAAEILRHVI